MRVKMIPYASQMGGEESGIKRVVEAYEKHAPDHDITFVPSDSDDYQVLAVHAGMTEQFPIDRPLLSICHGLYWTGDYNANTWEWRTNSKVIFAMRMSKIITVPSAWVGEAFRRDMHIAPIVVPHGIDWQEWQHDIEPESFVLWNKNRVGDVCDPRPVSILASAHPDIPFYVTKTNDVVTPNVKIIGLQPHDVMRAFVQRAAVYLSTTKETFGIGVLEALASGTPVLGFDFGGNHDLIEHGVNGYLARPGDYEDLENGLEYCMTNRKVLSANAIETAKKWSWDNAMEELKFALDLTAEREDPTIGVVIPTYNYADKVERAIRSAMNQTHPVHTIVVVDDGSSDGGETQAVVNELSKVDKRVHYVRQDNQGVAVARNTGISYCNTKYIICLDADDAIDPLFVEACFSELEKNQSLGIAYTGLLAVKPNGDQGVSPWPTDFNYDLQLERHNQIPTCCMFRREIWSRLGGYRQRYAPNGAGSEDAEFWLRAGAYGYDAKKVTDAPLFIYSWLSGRVSGNKEYHEVDWLAWHPWTKDKQHPFASVATPKHFSHPVRQYDEPLVSVVIPVSINHTKEVVNALDSLEAQTFRKWEAIVCDDTGLTGNVLWRRELSTSFPFVRFAQADHSGAGAARNAGVKIARGQFLLFLDADDWLYPEAIQRMIERWETTKAIVYTDYVGKAYIDRKMAADLGDRLLYYDEKTQSAVVRHSASTYDCSRAVEQPNPHDMYIWNLITSLTPKVWHDEIGGFDEKMSSWEDWDYWIRMARSGKCFDRIEDPLVVYRFYTGTRRELGVREHQNLIEYLKSKYAEEVPMPCNCGGNRGNNSAVLNQLAERAEIVSRAISGKGTETMAINDSELVLCIYDHPNRGQHMVIGAATQTMYGYRGGGEKFLVHFKDVAAQPNVFKPVVVEATAPMQEPKETPPPKPIKAHAKSSSKEATEVPEVVTADAEAFKLDMIPGVTEAIAKLMQAHGIQSLQDIVEFGTTNLLQIKGIGPSRADAIVSYAEQALEEEQNAKK